jgi:hypothetical protein
LQKLNGKGGSTDQKSISLISALSESEQETYQLKTAGNTPGEMLFNLKKFSNLHYFVLCPAFRQFNRIVPFFLHAVTIFQG